LVSKSIATLLGALACIHDHVEESLHRSGRHKKYQNERQLSPYISIASVHCAATLALATSANPLTARQLHKLPGVALKPATTVTQIQ
jgi:hypothetical protein